MFGSSADARATDALTLEACAQRAGLALACAFSSSAEFDADMIAERRAAGAYGPRRYRRQAVATAVAIAAALAIVIVVI